MDKSPLLERIQELTHPLSPISINHETRIRSLEGIRCVAFDFYGTMFISDVGDIGIDEEKNKDTDLLFKEALQATGFSLNKADAGARGVALFEEIIDNHVHNARNRGIDHPEPDITAVWEDVLSQLLQREVIEGDVDKAKAVEFGIEFEFRLNDIWPVPGLEDLLTHLLKKDLMLGIISNSQFYTPIAFEASLGASPETFGFEPELLIWSYESGRKKPSRDFYKLFIQAAEKKGLEPGEVLYVGNDIRKDIQPAKELGMKTALYVGDQRSIRHEAEDLEDVSFTPDLVIDDLHQIIKCI